jgi:hypothetical protein
MRLKVKIAGSSQKELSEIVIEFNGWPYRLNDIKLTKSQLEIDLGNVPVFWDQFLEHVPTLKMELKPAFIEVL